MTAARKKPQVAFLDGHVFKRDYVAIASFLVEFKDQPHTRIYVLEGTEWTHFDLEFDSCALGGISSPSRKLYCLGRDGEVVIEGPGESVEERIADSDRLGRLSGM